MDLLTAAMCGMGATAVASGNATSPPTTLILSAGFYGVHRAMRTEPSKILVALPALVWLSGHLWDLTPEKLARTIAPHDSMLRQVPEGFSTAVLLIALIVMVRGARARLGAALSTVTLLALGLGLACTLLPSKQLQATPGSLSLLVQCIERGWMLVARTLAAVCMALVGMGPVAVPPLPRRGGAIAGAIGALLLCATIAGTPSSVARDSDGALLAIGLAWLVANVLAAVGLSAIARAGSKPAGWVGVGFVVVGIVSVLPALAVFSKTDANGYVFVMSTPFTLLGLGIALFGWHGAPLETVRKALGAAFVAAFAGGALAWVLTYLSLARVTNAREPFGVARITTEPLAVYGLPLLATLLLYLASPPALGAQPGPRPASFPSR